MLYLMRSVTKAKLIRLKAELSLAQTHLQFTETALFDGIMDHFQEIVV